MNWRNLGLLLIPTILVLALLSSVTGPPPQPPERASSRAPAGSDLPGASLAVPSAATAEGSCAAGAWQARPVSGAVPVYWQQCAAGTHPAAAGGVGYQAGGLDVDGSAPGALQMYDPRLGSWTLLPSQPLAVYAAASGWIDGVLYVAGGFLYGWTGTTNLQLYNPAGNVWDDVNPPDIPAAGGRGGVTGGVAPCHSGVGQCLFAVGGAADGLFNHSTLETWEYDPAAGAWTQLEDRPLGSAEYGTLMGGGTGCGGFVFQGGDYRGYHDFFRLDPLAASGARWSQMSPIPVDAGAMSPALICGEQEQAIYLVGGDPDGNWNQYNTTVFRYDLQADLWTGPLPCELATGALGPCGFSAQGAMWIFGGTQGSFALDPPPHEALPTADGAPANLPAILLLLLEG